MYKLGKYEVHNWVDERDRAYRRIGVRYGKYGPDVNYYNIYISHPYYAGGGENLMYEIHFEGNILSKEYYAIYKNTEERYCTFYTLDDAKKRIDEFLKILDKLLVFI